MAILVLFDRFDSLIGWNVYQVAFIYGIVNVSFAVADAMTTGFDLFGDMVKTGDFDRILIRPRSTALQLAGQELTLRRISRLTPGLVALTWAAMNLDLNWTVANASLLIAVSRGRSVIVRRVDSAAGRPLHSGPPRRWR